MSLPALSRLPRPGHRSRRRSRRQDRSGDVVLITGASSGIGLATAQELSRQGASLVLASRGEQALERAAASCRELGAEVLVTPTDVRDADAVDRLFASALEHFGTVSAVVHASGVLAYGSFADVPRAVFESVVATHVHGTANVARASLRTFGPERPGRLVVVGSVLGKIGTASMSNYQTAKWAVHGLVRALRVEARHQPGFEVSLVVPGGVDTPIYTLAGNYGGREGRPPLPVYSPERVARSIIGAIDDPAREVSVGFLNPLMVFGFRWTPWLFDAIVEPLMRALAMSERPVEPHPGNVETPKQDEEQLHGSWQRHGVGDVVRLLLARR